MTAKAKKFKLKPKNYMSYVVIGAVLAVLVILYYTGNLKTSYTKMFHQIAYSILLAVSLNLVVGFLGELSLGHAGFMCVGAYIGGYCSNLLHQVIPVPVVVVILSLVIGGIAAAEIISHYGARAEVSLRGFARNRLRAYGKSFS